MRLYRFPKCNRTVRFRNMTVFCVCAVDTKKGWANPSECTCTKMQALRPPDAGWPPGVCRRALPRRPRSWPVVRLWWMQVAARGRFRQFKGRAREAPATACTAQGVTQGGHDILSRSHRSRGRLNGSAGVAQHVEGVRTTWKQRRASLEILRNGATATPCAAVRWFQIQERTLYAILIENG